MPAGQRWDQGQWACHLAAGPALRDNRRLLRVGPVAALAGASEYLEPWSAIARRIITRDYHRSSASPNIRARKLGASDQPRQVGPEHRLPCLPTRSKFSQQCARQPTGSTKGSSPGFPKNRRQQSRTCSRLCLRTSKSEASPRRITKARLSSAGQPESGTERAQRLRNRTIASVGRYYQDTLTILDRDLG